LCGGQAIVHLVLQVWCPLFWTFCYRLYIALRWIRERCRYTFRLSALFLRLQPFSDELLMLYQENICLCAMESSLSSMWAVNIHRVGIVEKLEDWSFRFTRRKITHCVEFKKSDEATKMQIADNSSCTRYSNVQNTRL
jgi:hypothetical protein